MNEAAIAELKQAIEDLEANFSRPKPCCTTTLVNLVRALRDLPPLSEQQVVAGRLGEGLTMEKAVALVRELVRLEVPVERNAEWLRGEGASGNQPATYGPPKEDPNG